MCRTVLIVVALICAVAAPDARGLRDRPGLPEEPPKVVELRPQNSSCDVDAGSTKQLLITFDRPMSRTGWSLCGGGSTFPKQPKPSWKDATTLVVEVLLEPDHDYALSLNCGNATNFRSAEGVALAPVPWRFSTLPAQLPKPAEQKKRNQQALSTLLKTLDEHYSYRDLRVHDWKALEKEGSAAVLAAPTDKAWASAAARMLAPTQDIHLVLRLGDRTFPTGTRSVDPMFRHELLARYCATEAAGSQARYGRMSDGIGYLLIAAWTQELDLAAVERALADLRETKALVVDVRMNSGGDETLAQRVASWFVDGRKVYAKNRNRIRPGKDGFGPVLERAVEGNQEPGKRYAHPIAVLTSRYVMSSNESFVMMLRQAKDCTVVGQPTFGSSGNPKPFDLGNGTTVLVPSWQDLRLDGTCLEGEGLVPDVLVQIDAAALEDKDPILEKALELLREKLRK